MFLLLTPFDRGRGNTEADTGAEGQRLLRTGVRVRVQATCASNRPGRSTTRPQTGAAAGGRPESEAGRVLTRHTSEGRDPLPRPRGSRGGLGGAVPGATTRAAGGWERSGGRCSAHGCLQRDPAPTAGLPARAQAPKGQGRQETLGADTAPQLDTCAHLKVDGHADRVPSSDRQQVLHAGVHAELGADWNTVGGLSAPSALGPQPWSRPGRPAGGRRAAQGC